MDWFKGRFGWLGLGGYVNWPKVDGGNEEMEGRIESCEAWDFGMCGIRKRRWDYFQGKHLRESKDCHKVIDNSMTKA